VRLRGAIVESVVPNHPSAALEAIVGGVVENAVLDVNEAAGSKRGRSGPIGVSIQVCCGAPVGAKSTAGSDPVNHDMVDYSRDLLRGNKGNPSYQIEVDVVQPELLRAAYELQGAIVRYLAAAPSECDARNSEGARGARSDLPHRLIEITSVVRPVHDCRVVGAAEIVLAWRAAAGAYGLPLDSEVGGRGIVFRRSPSARTGRYDHRGSANSGAKRSQYIRLRARSSGYRRACACLGVTGKYDRERNEDKGADEKKARFMIENFVHAPKIRQSRF